MNENVFQLPTNNPKTFGHSTNKSAKPSFLIHPLCFLSVEFEIIKSRRDERGEKIEESEPPRRRISRIMGLIELVHAFIRNIFLPPSLFGHIVGFYIISKNRRGCLLF